MKTVLAAIIILGIGVIGMCFNIIFRKNGKFPETEISRNENMRKMGIKCMREQDEEIFSKKKPRRNASCTGSYSDACTGCGFYEYEFGNKKPKQGE
ncbi:MAG: hypothetical protein MR685_05100 [Alistipes sp.]|jgi:hypothetical protein|uniref:hypothetical protein n=1 Tax=Candidatus Cryptobacteroides bacterium TaxID=3085639 RepID=UPI000337AF36|nr:hypothetical protein [Alistipes sp.]MDD7710493.1 hypothetical protein [Alistipes sp.]MDY3835292.1 hypothetical protein [Candidatus Cryptobacteroides sp.]MEE1406362.1 hypothetical protein [Bacteroidales bacterium]CDD18545.1 putative uncharacterized protein [Alistipes sp. CAG:435]